MLSESLLQELDKILREEFGETFDKKEIIEIADSFVSYFDLLNKIIINNKLNEKHKHFFKS